MSQTKVDRDQIVQFSGVVTTSENGEIVPLPFATVGVKGTSRGTVTEFDGFFSFVVVKGETVQFRSLGFKSVEVVIPDSVGVFYHMVLELEKEAHELPLIEILPIPSREHFKQEFLAMNIEEPLRDKARENLDANLLSEIRRNLLPDGGETSSIFLKEQAKQYYSYGQFKPQNILNPLAWKKFIESWKKGDFKKKDEDQN